MKPKIPELTEIELRYISNLDYSQNSEKHYVALKRVIDRGGIIDSDNEFWFPYEVIELCCNNIEEGHEKEYYVCLMIVIANIRAQIDKTKNISEYILDRIYLIEKLPSNYQEEILRFI